MGVFFRGNVVSVVSVEDCEDQQPKIASQPLLIV